MQPKALHVVVVVDKNKQTSLVGTPSGNPFKSNKNAYECAARLISNPEFLVALALPIEAEVNA